MTTKKIVEGILNSDRSILSKAITIIESERKDHQKQAKEILKNCLPYSGNSFRIAITGIPGVGKSTFIESFGQQLISKGKRIAVLTIDPSSLESKGSILGDKTRMEKLASKKEVFIRPSASKGSLGGVAKKTKESIILCEAAGYNHILIETVGVGQSETSVTSMVDFFILLMLSNTGDELQGIKKGIMEMADLIVINKADGNNIKNTKIALAELKNAIHLQAERKSNFPLNALSCSSINNEGMKEILTTIEKYVKFTIKNGYFYTKRKEQNETWIKNILLNELTNNLNERNKISSKLKKLTNEVSIGKIDPYTAVEKLMISFKYLKRG